ncbi:MAG: hypothetical protein D8M59_14720 [Planctomycetes bacterium]|nr:hypothetical protein [Planctomycetota bacterium]
MGVMVALVIFILLSLTLLLTTMLFYTKMEQARSTHEKAEADLQAFASPAQRESDEVRDLKNKARDNRVSVIRYLKEEMDQIAALAGGQGVMTRTELEASLGRYDVSSDQPAVARLRDLTDQVARLETQINDLSAQLDEANEGRVAEVNRREQLEQDHRTAIADLQSEIGRIQSRADEYARRINEAEASMDDRVRSIRDNYETQVGGLNAELDAERTQVALLTRDINELRDRVESTRLDYVGENMRPDGHIQEFGERETVYIDLGRKDNIILGMTFEVYSDVSDLKPNSAGIIPRGKGTIEVTRIQDSIATARIIRTTPGRAIVEGDVIINAIYDKNKKYTCFVFGQFDMDGEGGPSDIETEDMKARIREWGGDILDEFKGDMDFLVLGQQPMMPVQPPANAAPHQIRKYIADRKFFDQYHEYLAKAESLSIPVMNQNRLFTLIGYFQP